MAEPKRLKAKDRQDLTLRELFQLEAQLKPSGSVPKEVARHISRLEGILDPDTQQPILDMVVKDMDVGQVIGDTISEGKFRENDIKTTTYRSHSSSLITRLNTMFNTAGYGKGYVKEQVQAHLGEKWDEESGWKFLRGRKIPTKFQDDAYQQIKGILTDKDIPYEQRLQIAGHVMGGFRPENLANMKVSNFDASSGTLTFQDKKAGKPRIVVLNPMAVDIVKEAIRIQGDKIGKDARIFPNAKANQTKINNILKSRMDQVTFIRPDGTISPDDFTVYTLRNMHESLLTEIGLNEADTNYMNGRAPASEAAGYVSDATRRQRIDDANQKIVAKLVGYSGTDSVSQYEADTGLKLGDETKRIGVGANILTDKNYISTLPEGFSERLSGEYGIFQKDAIPPADPAIAAQYQQEQIAASKVREEANLLSAADIRAKRLKREAEMEGLEEAAIRRKVQNQLREKKIKEDELAKQTKDLAPAGLSAEERAYLESIGIDPDEYDPAPESPADKKPGLLSKAGRGLKSLAGVPVVGEAAGLAALTGLYGLSKPEPAFSMPTETGEMFEETYPESFQPVPAAKQAQYAGEVAEAILSPLPMTAREMYEQREASEQVDIEAGTRMSMFPDSPRETKKAAPAPDDSFLTMSP